MEDIAIVGMACLFPGARNIGEYWQNIIDKRNLISDPPPDWEAERYFYRGSGENDRIYCKRGGYLGPLATFDPIEHGVMPSSLDGGEPDHYLALKVAKEALLDAGYAEGNLEPERTEVIIGRGTYINRGVTNSFQHTVVAEQTLEILKGLHPGYTDDELLKVKDALKKSLPPFTAETVPGLVPNVLAGRIANRLNCMGTNYLVDAACASSLIALEHGARDLASGRCDLALIGGVNASIPPTMLVIFSLINALSRGESMKPFDASADGTMLGEGLGFVVLKRKSDAERDGDRIYSVLKSVGVASDGRALGLLAPRLEGEALAINRAYEMADLSPSTVGLIEAHGTGIPLGDTTEIEALRKVFGNRNGQFPSCAIGTVKSMIGHLIPASGMAGLIKTALAIYHKVLPPTLCDKPNPSLKLEETPFYINTEARPWIHGSKHPRRAGLNAFGFGGINAHAVLEEHTTAAVSVPVNLHSRWDTEVFIFESDSRTHLIDEINLLMSALEKNPGISMKDLAYTLNKRLRKNSFRLSIVAKDVDDLKKKLVHARDKLLNPSTKRIRERSGIYFFEEPLGKEGKTAFLFPGEGSQYAGMLSGLSVQFPEVRSVFDLMDSAFAGHQRGYVPSETVFPLPLGQGAGVEHLWAMDSGAESVFAANMAMLALMNGLNLRPDVMAGHSTGEYSALMASGILEMKSNESFIDFVLGVNGVYEDVVRECKIAEGALLTVGAADEEALSDLLKRKAGRLYLAMDNCPNQIVLCGAEEAIKGAEEELREHVAMLGRLPFNRAYHSPMFEPICKPLREYFNKLKVSPPRVETYSCITAAPYPDNTDDIRELATSQWARRVNFRGTIEAMYEAGVRIFVEVGPRGNLIAFVDDILRKRNYLAIPSNVHRLSDVTQLNHMVGLLAAHHVSLDASFLYRYRDPKEVPLDGDVKQPSVPETKRSPVKIALTLPRMELGRDVQHIVPKGSVMPDLSSPAGPSELPGRQVLPEASTASEREDRSRVMMDYLENMERFVEVQNEILKSYLIRKSGMNRPSLNNVETSDPMPEGVGSDLPFIRELVSFTPGEAAVALCRIDLDEDRFLLDHTLGGAVSQTDPSLTALPVIPMTFTMEILAEGASLLMPGLKLTGMREVRANRWIGLDDGTVTLRITATVRPGSSDEVDVKIHESESDGPAVCHRSPVAEGTMIFSPRYQEAPHAEISVLKNEKDSEWKDKELYGGFMFHGPLLQGVARMSKCGEDGALATLGVLPENELLRSNPRPVFLSDTVILDAAGQVVAYWTSERLSDAYHIFPFRLEALELFGPRLMEPETANCLAKISLVGDTMVRSDIDISGPDGRLRMRMTGWWDKRFDLPERLYRLRSSPCGEFLGRETYYGLCGDKSGIVCSIIDGIPRELLTDYDGIWMRVLAHIVLSGKERQSWSSIKGNGKRKLEWLLGRAAAKDAVRIFMKKHEGVGLCPADIEIGLDEQGRPLVESIRGNKHGRMPLVSISHTSGIAIALAGVPDGGTGIGVDGEVIRELNEGFDSIAFSETEEELIKGTENSSDEWRFRFWCAKEAASKALGIGLQGNPGNFQVKAVNKQTGEVNVVTSGDLQSRFPALTGEEVTVRTFAYNDLIIAVSII